MLTNLLYFLFLSSGSVFASAVYRRRFEDTLPITVFFIIIIQYIFGLVGALRTGAYVTFVLAAAIYVLALGYLIKRKSLRDFVENFFTPGFAVFAFFFLVLSIFNRNKLASSWDEFSHWADVVKAMTAIDDLATNPLSDSVFKSYVPAMPLFQYNLQVFNQTIAPESVFNEGLLYFSYQIATYSLLIQALRKVQWNKILHTVLIAIVIFVLPSVFYSFFDIVYIDAYLGVLAGFSLLCLFQEHTDDWFNVITFSLSLFVLTLTKDAGFTIGLFLCVMYFVKAIVQRKTHKISIGCAAIVFFALLVPKFSWNYHLSILGVGKAFGQKIDIGGFFQSIAARSPSDYRWETFRNFSKALIESGVRIGDTNINVSYIFLFTLLLGVLYVVISLSDRETKPWKISSIMGLIIATFFYMVGMCAAYMFKFVEYEAVRLSSFDRYMNIYATMLITTAWVLCIDLLQTKGFMNIKHGYIVFLLVAFLPASRAGGFIAGEYSSGSRLLRSAYVQATEKVLNKCGADDGRKKVYIVSQATSGFDYWVLRYSIRPHQSNPNFTWSIGKPFFEGDIWTQAITVEKWQENIKKNYDYVLLYSVNDYFIDNFSSLFTEPELIKNNSLYWVDKDTGMLYLVS